MIGLIENLFSSYGFNSQKVANGYFFKTDIKSQKTQYWLVIKVKDIGSLVKEQSELFDACKQVCQHPEFEKNAYMLVLYETDNNLDTSTQNKIMSIEEDPYFFKKQVLYYSVQELTTLNESMNGQSLFYFLQSQLPSQETFSHYKTNPRFGNWQSLLYRTAMKLPFVEININASDGLASLFEENRKRIESLKDGTFVDFDKRFFELFDSSKESSVQTDNAIELLTALLPELGGQVDGN